VINHLRRESGVAVPVIVIVIVIVLVSSACDVVVRVRG
jgi:hypothetical protein